MAAYANHRRKSLPLRSWAQRHAGNALRLHRWLLRLMLAALIGTAALPVQAGRLDAMYTRIWDAESRPDHFPELHDASLAVPWLLDRPSLGVAFSGGGTRSATATLGQLRALDALGWVDQIRYFSLVSGGSWAAMPYIYLPADADEETFIGPYWRPQDLNDRRLGSRPRGSMTRAITKSGLAKCLDEVFRCSGDELYAGCIGRIFLKPFGLGSEERFFTFHERALRLTIAAHRDIGDSESRPVASDFIAVERVRPYPIVGATILGLKERTKISARFPIEMTPLYTGVRRVFSLTDDQRKDVVIGGGYLESYAYDSLPPVAIRHRGRLRGALERQRPFCKSKRYRFTLSDVLGASGAAPQRTLVSISADKFGFPEFDHWSVSERARSNGPLTHPGRDLSHGDGGHIDNVGLMPLLARRVENIIAFVNTRTPFKAERWQRDEVIDEETIYDNLIAFFRTDAGSEKPHIRVFKDGPGRLKQLVEKFAKLHEQGRPLVYCDSYEVDANEWHVTPEYRPNICWVYLHRAGQWEAKARSNAAPGSKIIDVLDNSLRKENSNFPHYNTFFPNFLKVIDLEPREVNAMSNLAAWTVCTEAATIRSGLQGAALPKSAFEKRCD